MSNKNLRPRSVLLWPTPSHAPLPQLPGVSLYLQHPRLPPTTGPLHMLFLLPKRLLTPHPPERLCLSLTSSPSELGDVTSHRDLFCASDWVKPLSYSLSFSSTERTTFVCVSLLVLLNICLPYQTVSFSR